MVYDGVALMDGERGVLVVVGALLYRSISEPCPTRKHWSVILCSVEDYHDPMSCVSTMSVTNLRCSIESAAASLARQVLQHHDDRIEDLVES